MMIWIMKMIIIWAVAFYIGTVSLLYFLQDRFIFPAPQWVENVNPPDGFHQVQITTPDGEHLFGLHRPSGEDEATILVFHGNGDAAIFQTEKGLALANAGFGVLLVEYRGYPGSTGSPSEAGLAIDAKAAYDFIQNQRPQSIGIYAHSLGTGVAVQLATERTIQSIVLESPFDSLMAIAKKQFPWAPVSLLLRHKFQSDLKIEKITAPILIMHGDMDNVIPIEHGKKLYQKAKNGTRFETLSGAGHNDLSAYSAVDKAVKFFQQTLKKQ